MQITYLDGFRFAIENRGLRVITDQRPPLGGGEGLEPVELLAASLGSCVGVYAIDYLHRNGLRAEGFRVEVDWSGAAAPRRIGQFTIKVHVPGALTERQRASLERIVHGCTVHNTLTHAPGIDIELVEAGG
ncbi:MAG: OsmC family protein [Deltaproteobacteria bacterium]|nr:OsmC family protein [Deltaproteobacteria bacterium]